MMDGKRREAAERMARIYLHDARKIQVALDARVPPSPETRQALEDALLYLAEGQAAGEKNAPDVLAALQQIMDAPDFEDRAVQNVVADALLNWPRYDPEESVVLAVPKGATMIRAHVGGQDFAVVLFPPGMRLCPFCRDWIPDDYETTSPHPHCAEEVEAEGDHV